jgi:ABC-2 type transport system permease protein
MMNRADVILTFIRYEIKRAIARRKVLALIAFTVLLDTLPYYALSTAGTDVIPGPAYPYVWVAGVFAVQPLFLNFTAILIAAGAMSEEYEQGTAELLLSKPVRRNDYFAGKFLGGYSLFLGILALNMFLSVASAFTFFGMQNSLDILPGLFLVQAFSSLIFYSLAFMLGEIVRRSSLAYIFSSAVFFSSFIISAYMGLIFTLTRKSIYRTVQIYLPTSPANSLPIQYASSLLPQTVGTVLEFVGANNAVVPTIDLSVAILLAYTIPAIAIAAAYFWFADISRKMS